jgi:biotin carboxyl carrier protein
MFPITNQFPVQRKNMVFLHSKKYSDNISNEGNQNKKPRYKSLFVEGTRYKTNYTRKFENRGKWEIPDNRKLLSFIPGVIVKVNVKKGQKVRRGENVIILDAMKMQNRITIQRDGVIKNIYVEEGQKVAKGAILLELD